MDTLAALSAVITFAAPALAWGVLAAMVPVLIHLMLRQRPRRQVLPTLQFLLASHRSHQRAQRLKHLLLLACRVLLVRGSCGSSGEGPRSSAFAADVRRPVSAVICVDDSASMGYRYRGQTRLEKARELAMSLAADTERFPPGSELALITGSTRHRAGWTGEPRSLQKLLATLLPGDHNRSVGDLLQQAPALFKAARHPVHEVYLFTDLTEQSWTPKPILTELHGLFVLDVGEAENSNLMLSVPKPPSGDLAADLSSSLPLTVRSGALAAEPELELEVDGQPRDRQVLGPLPAGTEMSVDLALPPMTPGLHAVSVTLKPSDGLAADNRRVLFLPVGPLPVVAVCGSAKGPVGAMVAAMIAPAAQSPAQRRFDLREVPPSGVIAAVDADPRAVFLADPGGLSKAAWDRLAAYAHAGGTLVVIPGPVTTVDDFQAGQSILPAPDLRVPFLAPFADPAIDSINDREAFRRLGLGKIHADASVVAPFSDGTPAILQRRLGRGRVLLLAFSPAAEWGQFGTQAAPMIVLLHALLDSLAPPSDHLAAFHAGQAVFSPLNEPMTKGSLTLRERISGQTDTLTPTGDLLPLPTERMGLYEVSIEGAGDPVQVYSVNVAETESDLRRADPAVLATLAPAGVLTVARSLDELVAGGTRTAGPVELWVPLGLGLLGLLVVESFFSNRFHRRPAADAGE